MRWILTALVSLITFDLLAQEESTGNPLNARRDELRKKFDADGDGWLNASEREAMRLERARPARRDRRQRREWTRFPKDVLARFDKDADSKLNTDESRSAWAEALSLWRKIEKQFDANEDGELSDEESEELERALEDEEIESLPFFLRSSVGRIQWETFDLDQDGRLNAAELETARLVRKTPGGARVEKSPSRIAQNEEPAENTKTAETVEPEETENKISRVEFSVRGGFFEKAFELSLRSKTPGAEIRYTLDCSDPLRGDSLVYSEPIRISKTTVLRAAAIQKGWASKRSRTATYLFLDDVVHQSPDGLPPEGAPYRWGRNTVDYGMDPRIVNAPEYREKLIPALKSLPSVSLVGHPDDLFGPRGIYGYARMDGRDAERPGSVEILFPDGRPGVAQNCGLRIRGGFSRTSGNPKHAFRLFFRKEYGKGKLRYPLFGPSGAEAFDHLDFRCSQNYSWSLGGDDKGLFVRDQFSRDLQLAMGHPAARGDYYHLYLNGQYWGLFNSCERPKSTFGANYFGGTPEEYDTIKIDRKQGGTAATDGNTDAWNLLYDLAKRGLQSREAYERILGNGPDGQRDPKLEKLVEVDNLIDYMLVIFWAGNMDAPVTIFAGNRSSNNWYGLRRRNGPDGFRFFVWDAEHTLLDLNIDRTGPFPAGQEIQTSNPQWLWQQCLANEEFRVRVADRIEKHFAGVLSTESLLKTFDARTKQIEEAVICESARWGDSPNSRGWGRRGRGNTLHTRDEHWREEVRRIREDFIPQRSEIVWDQLWRQGLIPETPTPVVSSDENSKLALQAKRGAIFYTLDGSDPRLVGGKLSPKAKEYKEPLTVAAGQTLHARTLEGDEWSALKEWSR